MGFSEKLVDNSKLYSFEIQNELQRDFHMMKSSTISLSNMCFSISHAGIYIFTVAALPPDKTCN